MKTIITSLLLSLVVISYGQMGFNYQSVLRNSIGEPIENQSVSFMMTITNSLNDTIFKEEHHPTTSAAGVVSFVIGEGSIHFGDLGLISWGTDTYYLGIELDETGGSSYQSFGNSKFQAVPFAMYAASSNEADGDPANEIQSLSIDGDEITISSGNTINLPSEVDGSVSNELQSLSINGTQVSISDGNTINLPTVADGSATNELQTLSLSGDELSISNGNTVTLPSSTAASPTYGLEYLSAHSGSLYQLDDTINMLISVQSVFGAELKFPANPVRGQILYIKTYKGAAEGFKMDHYRIIDGDDSYHVTSTGASTSWDDLAPSGLVSGGTYYLQLIYTGIADTWEVFSKYSN